MSIYTIYKATNKINNKSYIGFTQDYKARITAHKSKALNNSTKASFHAAIRKYGFENFEWEIIYQSKDRDYTLNTMEKHFIEEYKTHKKKYGYNMSLGGECTILNDECLKTYQFYDPDDNLIEITNLQKFCKENNLDYIAMINVYRKEYKTHRRYKNIDNKGYIERKNKTYKIIAPDDTIIEIDNISKYAKENNLDRGSLMKLINGKKILYKGYRNINHPDVKIKIKTFKFLDKDDNIIELKSKEFMEFCKENDLSYFCMVGLCNPNQKSQTHKGYKTIYKKSKRLYKLNNRNETIK